MRNNPIHNSCAAIRLQASHCAKSIHVTAITPNTPICVSFIIASVLCLSCGFQNASAQSASPSTCIPRVKAIPAITIHTATTSCQELWYTSLHHSLCCKQYIQEKRRQPETTEAMRQNYRHLFRKPEWWSMFLMQLLNTYHAILSFTNPQSALPLHGRWKCSHFIIYLYSTFNNLHCQCCTCSLAQTHLKIKNSLTLNNLKKVACPARRNNDWKTDNRNCRTYSACSKSSGRWNKPVNNHWNFLDAAPIIKPQIPAISKPPKAARVATGSVHHAVLTAALFNDSNLTVNTSSLIPVPVRWFLQHCREALP